MANDYKAELQKLLREVFQFDHAELDFGIYRIMNQKRTEVERFIQKDLIDAVDDAFKKYESSNKAEAEKELEELKKQIRENIGSDSIDEAGEVKEELAGLALVKKYLAKKAEVEEAGATDTAKAEVFSHIYHFFNRYYDEGDFLSLRRYSKENKYVIPYNGEEVVLHWANKDQYYIKTTENFYNYTFKAGDRRIHFKISAAETEKNNVKGEKRFFFLKEGEESIGLEDGELFVYFEYRAPTDEEKACLGRDVQKKLVEEAMEKILASVDEEWNKALTKKTDSGLSMLEKNLVKYTKKNTSDYFIHKDLKGFLKRELDFYIKNEVIRLEELEAHPNPRLYLARVRVFRDICDRIIDFLAQIEDFQKSLWEKKKFVLRTDYCITLDKVPEEFYPEIIENEAQIQEWKDLYKLDEIEKGTLHYNPKKGLVIDIDYLKANPYLVLDTKFFSQDFKDRLLATFEDLDEETGGLMIKSENWQALNLLLEKYREKVKCCYIDPPYNTGSDDFVYKDNYQHSSWLAMVRDRLKIAKELLVRDGVFYISIGKEEINNLVSTCNDIFGEHNRLGICTRVMKTGGSKGNFFSPNTEYVLAYSKSIENVLGFRTELKEELINKVYTQIQNEGERKGQKYRLMGLYQAGLDVRPNQRYWVRCPDESYVIPPGEAIPTEVYDGSSVLPKKGDGVWRWTIDRYQKELVKGNIVFIKSKSSSLIDEKGEKAKWNIYTKIWLEDRIREGRVPVDLIQGYENRHSSQEMKNLGLNYDFPKPVGLIKHLAKIMEVDDNYLISDFFAGSGTTGDATLKLNKGNQGKRKFLLIDMGDYFDFIMKPRIQKVMFSNDWKDGKPTSKDGVSHMFKYQYLEQYEDTLNNIEFLVDGKVQKTLDSMDDYLLKYMLDFETRGSACRVNVDMFKKPFDYKLKVTDSDNEQRIEKVDLVETFNYLLGIHVKQIKAHKHNSTYYRVVYGVKDDEKIAVIWRDTEGLDLKADKKFIEETLLKDYDADRVYVNGDSFIKGAQAIEPEFKKLMGG